MQDNALEDAANSMLADAQARVEAAERMAPALEAAEAGDAAAMGAALDAASLAVDEPGEDGDTCLHIGCLYGKLAIVQECLSRGADVRARDEDNSTPLHDAAAGGHDAIVRLLLAGGAEVAATDDDGDSPLHLASNGGHAHVVRALMEHIGNDAAARQLCGCKNALGLRPADLAEDPALLALLTLDDGEAADANEAGAALKKRRGVPDE